MTSIEQDPEPIHGPDMPTFIAINGEQIEWWKYVLTCHFLSVDNSWEKILDLSEVQSWLQRYHVHLSEDILFSVANSYLNQNEEVKARWREFRPQLLVPDFDLPTSEPPIQDPDLQHLAARESLRYRLGAPSDYQRRQTDKDMKMDVHSDYPDVSESVSENIHRYHQAGDEQDDEVANARARSTTPTSLPPSQVHSTPEQGSASGTSQPVIGRSPTGRLIRALQNRARQGFVPAKCGDISDTDYVSLAELLLQDTPPPIAYTWNLFNEDGDLGYTPKEHVVRYPNGTAAIFHGTEYVCSMPNDDIATFRRLAGVCSSPSVNFEVDADAVETISLKDAVIGDVTDEDFLSDPPSDLDLTSRPTSSPAPRTPTLGVLRPIVAASSPNSPSRRSTRVRRPTIHFGDTVSPAVRSAIHSPRKSLDISPTAIAGSSTDCLPGEPLNVSTTPSPDSSTSTKSPKPAARHRGRRPGYDAAAQSLRNYNVPITYHRKGSDVAAADIPAYLAAYQHGVTLIPEHMEGHHWYCPHGCFTVLSQPRDPLRKVNGRFSYKRDFKQHLKRYHGITDKLSIRPPEPKEPARSS